MSDRLIGILGRGQYIIRGGFRFNKIKYIATDVDINL